MSDVLSKYFGIGVAIEMIKKGKKVCRKGWNGKGVFLYYVKANSYPTQSGVAIEVFPEGMVPYEAYIALKNVNGTIDTWSPSGSDTLADDWMVYEEETYMDRLIVERDELKLKFEKLNKALIRDKVPKGSIGILKAQSKLMVDYLTILNNRIAGRLNMY